MYSTKRQDPVWDLCVTAARLLVLALITLSIFGTGYGILWVFYAIANKIGG